MKVSVYNLDGKSKESVEISDEIFGIKTNPDLIHQVFVSIASNRRQVLAHTKTRAERAGSGRKPWKQKGTGRARVGSVRTPIWRKGGVVFGPRKDRNYSKKTNKKMRIQATRMVIGEKIKSKSVFVLEKLDVKEKKTKYFAEILKNLKIKGSVLWSFETKEKDLRRLTNNLSKVDNILTSQLNVFDMLNRKYLIMSKESLTLLEKKYKSQAKKK
jgi:large subunit ribosomal protein L4